MNLKSFIYSLIALTSISCTNANIAGSDIYAILKGTVTDELGEPIEHMEVTIEMSKRNSPRTLYTSSDGTFICDIIYNEVRNVKDIHITLTDTDGEENGGLFTTLSENIHLYDEATSELPMTLNLDFHCSLATL